MNRIEDEDDAAAGLRHSRGPRVVVIAPAVFQSAVGMSGPYGLTLTLSGAELDSG